MRYWLAKNRTQLYRNLQNIQLYHTIAEHTDWEMEMLLLGRVKGFVDVKG